MKREKVIAIAYVIAFFVLLCIVYADSSSIIWDTYGLVSGERITEFSIDFFGIINLVYVNIVESIFLFFGEKASVVVSFHIACSFAAFLLLFLALKRFYKPWLTYGVPVVLLVFPFVIPRAVNYDGWIVMEFLFCLMFYLVVCVVFVVFKLDYKSEVSLMKESLAERERKESQAPKTIVNERGETITLLANPLPGPKKHVKKTLDYDIDVPEDMMFYDKNDCDYDDYDIR